jgi:type IV pilus assembly protein PilF
MLRLTSFLLLFSGMFLLQGCVTTTDSTLTRNADPEEAVERYVELGMEYIKREEFTRAQKHLTRALELDNDNAPAHAAMGLIFSRQGDAELAEKSFRTALDIDPGYTRGHTYFGAFLFAEQRYEEALGSFMKAVSDAAYSGRSQIYTNIALCQIQLSQPDKAIAAYERSLQLNRFNGRALAGMTEVLLSKNDFKNAQFYYNRLVRLIADENAKHSAQTLWQGVRLARHFNARKQEVSLATLLEELYPDSPEYKQYRSELNGN